MTGGSAHAVFEQHRKRLAAYAYRMMGSRADADDLVQEAWVSWHKTDSNEVANTRAYLFRVVHNLCLDRLKSARVRRERYVGAWLPEPIVDVQADYSPDAARATELADDLSFALMLTLERLSPSERAAFLLHDVFAYPFAEVAQMLDQTESNCRQLARRARIHLKQGERTRRCSPEQARKIAQAFANATQHGDMAQLAAVLAEDVTLISDGGGRVAAVPKPLTGRGKVAKAWLGFAKVGRRIQGLRTREASVNGLPGFVLEDSEGVIQTIALEVDRSHKVTGIYVVRNPDKLSGVTIAD